MKIKEVSLLDLAKGAILEQIDLETGKILSNILDPNTDSKKTRKLQITLSLKPDADRQTVAIEAQAKSTLAPIMPIAIRLIVEEDRNGKPRASELTRDDPNQVHMFEEEGEPAQNVIRMGVAR